MDISRKTDYALRMLAMLAEDPERLLSVRTAAEEVNVPYSFARSIQHGLVQAGIVESLRGVHGGMRLKVSPDDVTIRQVVEAVQGPMVMNDCTAPDGDCARMGACCYHPLWAGAQALMRDYLDSVSLGDIVAHRQFPAVDPKFADREAFPEYATCACLPGGIAPHKEHSHDSGPLSFDDSFGRGPALSRPSVAPHTRSVHHLAF